MYLLEDGKNIVFMIEGGVGKNLMATPVLKALKDEYPNSTIVVISPHIEVFDRLPFVDRAFKLGDNKYLYDDYIKKGSFINFNPYNTDWFRFRKKSVIKIWYDILGLRPADYEPRPIMKFSQKELEIALNIFNNLNTNFNKESNKKLIFTQYCGGNSAKFVDANGNPVVRQDNLRNANKAISEIADALKDDFLFLAMKRPEEEASKTPNIITLVEDVHYRIWGAIMNLCDGYLGIDSLGMHMAAAFDKPSFVLWGPTCKDNFGYHFKTKHYTGVCEANDLYCNKGIARDLNVLPCPCDNSCMNSLNIEAIKREIWDEFYEEKIDVQNEKIKQSEESEVNDLAAHWENKEETSKKLTPPEMPTRPERKRLYENENPQKRLKDINEKIDKEIEEKRARQMPHPAGCPCIKCNRVN